MNNQGLMIIQIVFAFFFIWWLLSRRGGIPRPTVLNLEKDLEIQKELRHIDSYQPRESVIRDVNVYHKRTHNAFQFETQIKGIKSEKQISVIFMWNGHSWDAHEVFGLSADSSLEQVTIKYQEMLLKSDDGQKKFLDEAYNSIIVKFK